MRNLLLILLLPILVFACSQGGDVEITVNVSNKKSNKIKLYVLDEEYQLELDESGRAVKNITIPQKTYAYVYSNNRSFTIYLTPHKNIDISLDANDRARRIFLYCDDNGINSYLATERNINYGSSYASYRFNEKSYLDKLKNNIDKKREYLVSKKLPSDFTVLEKERISYKAIEDIFFYPVYRRYFTKKKDYIASKPYNRFIDSMFIERPELLVLQPYQDFLIRYVEKKALKTRSNNKTLLSISRQIDYVLENVESPKIKDFLINAFAYPFIKQKGIVGNDDIVKAYRDNVSDSRYKKRFMSVVERYKGLEKGKLSPYFSFKDINGDMVSLKDLKGKYVYIDVWATWCKPCKHEIISFQRLIREYRDRNISFVGISLDDNYHQWQNFVERRKLKGIQLYADKNESFSDDYVINTIPRFILIDKEGNICLLYTSPSPRDVEESRMPSSA